MDFENVGLNYTNTSNTNTLTFNPGSWSFASPPKWLSNFPVTIKKIYYMQEKWALVIVKTY